MLRFLDLVLCVRCLFLIFAPLRTLHFASATSLLFPCSLLLRTFSIYRDKTGLHDELTNWSGTSGEYNDIKREYENGPAFWRSIVAVTPEFRRGLPEVTFLIEM